MKHYTGTRYSHNLGRFRILDKSLFGRTVTLVGIYGPNSDNSLFCGDVVEIMGAFTFNNIMCRNFNYVFNLDCDKKEGELGLTSEPVTNALV